MTPDRSENKPPSAARINGVERRTVDAISDADKSSTM
jgi:hypothetical protein